ncbi:hypothetical protein VTK26DRAFT_1463 [Humicola hyalothermophila]
MTVWRASQVSTGHAYGLAASARHLVIADARFIMQDTKTFDACRLSLFKYDGRIRSFTLNEHGSLLACFTTLRTWVWKTTDWTLKVLADNRKMRSLSKDTHHFKFDEHDTLTLVTSELNVYKLATLHPNYDAVWEQMETAPFQNPDTPKDGFPTAPSSLALNGTCTQLAHDSRSGTELLYLDSASGIVKWNPWTGLRQKTVEILNTSVRAGPKREQAPG